MNLILCPKCQDFDGTWAIEERLICASWNNGSAFTEYAVCETCGYSYNL